MTEAPWKDSGVASLTVRRTWFGLTVLIAGSCMAACSSTGPSPTDTSTTTTSSGSDVAAPDPTAGQGVCAEIDQRFYYPTVPAGGYTISRTTASDIEQLLQHAPTADLRAEAHPLHKAIEADNEAAMVSVIMHVANTTCGATGTPPAT